MFSETLLHTQNKLTHENGPLMSPLEWTFKPLGPLESGPLSEN